LQRLATFAPEVAVLDIGLPDLNGYELARRFRARSKSTILIALTGYGTPEDRRQSDEAGFDCHLTKPVAIAELTHVIDSARSRRALNSV
jgi:DNA-binding response OmpR family regulator